LENLQFSSDDYLKKITFDFMLAKKVLDFKNSCKGNEIESRSMGEAKRRKQNGLPSKGPKKSLSKGVKNKLFIKYPRLPSSLLE